MKIDIDGEYYDFCCEWMERFSKGAQKCITFDPFYKKYELDQDEYRACIYSLHTGESKREGERKREAGRNLIPIYACPWCGKSIVFIVDEPEELTWTETKSHITFNNHSGTFNKTQDV